MKKISKKIQLLMFTTLSLAIAGCSNTQSEYNLLQKIKSEGITTQSIIYPHESQVTKSLNSLTSINLEDFNLKTKIKSSNKNLMHHKSSTASSVQSELNRLKNEVKKTSNDLESVIGNYKVNTIKYNDYKKHLIICTDKVKTEHKRLIEKTSASNIEIDAINDSIKEKIIVLEKNLKTLSKQERLSSIKNLKTLVTERRKIYTTLSNEITDRSEALRDIAFSCNERSVVLNRTSKNLSGFKTEISYLESKLSQKNRIVKEYILKNQDLNKSFSKLSNANATLISRNNEAKSENLKTN